MNEIYMTVQGNLASDVKYRLTPGGVPMAQFRVASSASRLDGTGQWRETGKAYFEVTCWRRAADNARASLAKGLPVVIHARLRQRQVTRAVQGSSDASYEQTYNDLEAVGFGLDLSRCRSRFERSPVGPQLAVSDSSRDPASWDPASRDSGRSAPGQGPGSDAGTTVGSIVGSAPDPMGEDRAGPGWSSPDAPGRDGSSEGEGNGTGAPGERDLPGVA